MVDVIARWDSRPDWSGESPASGAILLQRFSALTGSGATRALADAATPSRTWTLRNASAATAGLTAGRWGNALSLNRNTPGTEQTSLTVPHFPGLWPSSGRMLFKAWAALSFAQAFTPIISTRNTSGKAPLVYLSTQSDGRPRAQVYNAAGTLLLDQSEPIASIGWTPTALDWVCYLWLVDMDARTSQIALVRRNTGQVFVGPTRALSGAPNAACEAAFEVGTLSPTAAYWAGGYIDEVGYWQPAGAVDLAEVAAGVARSLPARGADATGGVGLLVSDSGVSATAAATLLTGARRAAWGSIPDVTASPALAATPAALLSVDGGASWDAPATLPATFDGLVRWSVPMYADETLQAIDMVVPPQAPTLTPGGTITLPQAGTATVTLAGTWSGTPKFSALAPPEVRVVFSGVTMTVTAGWSVGAWPIVVTVTDDTGLTGTATWTLDVSDPDVPESPSPVYAEAPLIVHSALGERAAIISAPMSAVLAHEVNGEQTLTFTIPNRHPARGLVQVERIVEVAGELYRVRGITSSRNRQVPVIEVYCEARFYDLGTAGQVDAVELSGVQPGTAIAIALQGTGWTIGRVNVTTTRTYSIEEGSPLAVLRQIAKVHGGDLVFDNTARTVSLLTFAGRRDGRTFIYGHDATDAKRVEDTTTLVTRIYARNADGMTIADVNGGKPYLEDYTWTSEIRTAVYDFAAGTNPYTMLAMARATLGKRAKPKVSYEVSVVDLSAWSGQALDRHACGDEVRVVDTELAIDTTDRIVRLEYDLLRPWASKVVLSEKLRELGDTTGTDAATLTTGTDIDTRDMVPFNLLLNARFDNGLAHWAASGARIVPDGATGPNAVELAGGGLRWIEQTVAPDTRDVYTLSFVMDAQGWPDGLSPEVLVVAEVTYDDGSTETIEQKVT